MTILLNKGSFIYKKRILIAFKLNMPQKYKQTTSKLVNIINMCAKLKLINC
jgi:hypothetical protein